MDMLIGVMGFGGMGHYHVENMKLPGVRFTAACDIDPVQLQDAAGYGLKSYLNDEDGFFEDPKINTVLLTVPNHLHKRYAVKAAKAGKNVICEKPAALTPEEFDEMTAVAQNCGVLLEVHQNRRLDRDFQIVKRAYDDKIIGDIFNIESNLHMPSGRVHNWHQFKEYGGGMLYDWGVHCIDQALALIPDKLYSVYADMKGVFHSEVDDYYKIILKFQKGETVTLNLSTYVLKPYPRWLVCGTRGTCVVDGFDGSGKILKTTELVEKLAPRIEPGAAGPTRSFRPVPPGKMYEEALPEVHASPLDFYRNYQDVMNGKAGFMIKNEEVRRVLCVMMACFESARLRESVRFTYGG